MAWKSVMSSTSHHALFLCSEVSEANGNSSFSPSPPTPTFILSFLLSFSPHPPSPHCGAALICIEEAPPPLKFPPPSLPLHLNSLPISLFFASVSFHSCSLPPFKSCVPYFLHISNFKRPAGDSFLSSHENRGATCSSALTSSLPPLVTPSLPASLSTVPINQSPFLTFHRSSPASYREPETKQAPIIPPATHPPTYPSASDWAWLVNLPEAFSV